MTDRNAKHPTGPLPRDADGNLILDNAKNAHAYLILVIDTRPSTIKEPVLNSQLQDWRKLTVDIFGDRTPTLPGFCHVIHLISASGPDYGECHRALLAMVDDPSPLNVFAWTQPLLSDRARR